MMLALSLTFSLQTSARAAEPKATPASNTPQLAMKAAGSLLLVGGGKLPNSVRDQFLKLAGGKDARVVVIPTASMYADQPAPLASYLFWREQNVQSVEVLHTRSRNKANDPAFVRCLRSATAVWMTGGDQSRLSEAYLNTAVERELKKLLDRGGVIGGTSAGSSVMSSVMITGGKTRATLGMGLGLTPGMIVDQHFTNRNRMGRLVGALTDHPDYLGLGIDEQTAALVKGSTLSVIGNANVFVCMSPTATESVNVQRLKSGEQIDLVSVGRTMLARARKTRDRATLTSNKHDDRDATPMQGR
jgi:cyanophycinase